MQLPSLMLPHSVTFRETMSQVQPFFLDKSLHFNSKHVELAVRNEFLRGKKIKNSIKRGCYHSNYDLPISPVARAQTGSFILPLPFINVFIQSLIDSFSFSSVDFFFVSRPHTHWWGNCTDFHSVSERGTIQWSEVQEQFCVFLHLNKKVKTEVLMKCLGIAFNLRYKVFQQNVTVSPHV